MEKYWNLYPKNCFFFIYCWIFLPIWTKQCARCSWRYSRFLIFCQMQMRVVLVHFSPNYREQLSEHNMPLIAFVWVTCKCLCIICVNTFCMSESHFLFPFNFRLAGRTTPPHHRPCMHIWLLLELVNVLLYGW